MCVCVGGVVLIFLTWLDADTIILQGLSVDANGLF